MTFRRFVSEFRYKSLCCGYPFELHRLQMGTHNICRSKEVNKKYTGCNLKTTKLLDYALIGVCAVIRSNTVFLYFSMKTYYGCSQASNEYPQYVFIEKYYIQAKCTPMKPISFCQININIIMVLIDCDGV